jgi:hypothetical protein
MNELVLIKEEIDSDSRKFVKKMFPTANTSGKIELLRLEVNEEDYGYICLEYTGDVCQLHLCVVKEHRTKEKIMHLVKGFTEVVHPWVKERGIKRIVVQCAYKDKKTMELFKTFGFAPEDWWIGIMEV